MILAEIPSPEISEIQLGPFTVRFYALFIIAGIVVATWLTSRRLAARDIERGAAVDIALWAVPIGIVGGRFYHVFTHPGDYFYPQADLWRVFYIWEGGLALFGSILFGAVGAYIGCRRARVPFTSFGDAVVPGLLVAQAIGRLGNYFNQELFGSPTTLPWGLRIDASNPAFPAGLPADTLFHPLFLYEMLWNLSGAALILLIERRTPLRWGKALGLYLAIYGTGRAWFESFRIDPTELVLFGIKINLAVAALAAVGGIVLLIVQSRRHPGPRQPSATARDAPAHASTDPLPARSKE